MNPFLISYFTGYGMTLGFPTIVIPALKANATNGDGEFSLTNEEISWFSMFDLILLFTFILVLFVCLRYVSFVPIAKYAKHQNIMKQLNKGIDIFL